MGVTYIKKANKLSVIQTHDTQAGSDIERVTSEGMRKHGEWRNGRGRAMTKGGIYCT